MRLTRRAGTVALAIPVLAAMFLAPSGASAAQAAAECVLPGGDAGSIDYRYFPRPIGTVKALMIFVDFPDAPAGSTTARYEALFLPAAPAWYEAASYGQLHLAVTTVPRWIRMPHASTSYAFERGLSYEDHAAYIADAVAAANPTVNFAGYQLYYIVANEEAAAISFSPAFLGGRYSGITADGATIGFAATFGADASGWGFKLLNHETGHLFGLPDLYSYAEGPDQFPFTGGWDIMGNIAGQGPDYLAWFKWQLGWLSASQVTCLDTPGTTEVVLTPDEVIGAGKLVVLRTGASTAIAAEFRTAAGNDAAGCDKGVLIYAINNALQTGEGPVRVRDAAPGAALPAGCSHELDDGAWDPSGPAFSDPAKGITIEVLALDAGSARIRVTRTSSYTPPDVRHARRLTFTTSSRTSPGFVTATGQLSVPDGFTNCRNSKMITLQEYRSGTWINVRTAATNSSGRWTYTWKARADRYRLVAGQVIVGTRPRNICLAVTSSSRTVR